MSLWGTPCAPSILQTRDLTLSCAGHGEDTWAAFLTERDAILDVLEHVPNVIVLSGDRHEFAAASLRNTVTEFSTSPMNMFYLPIRTLSQKHGRGPTGEDALLKCELLYKSDFSASHSANRHNGCLVR